MATKKKKKPLKKRPLKRKATKRKVIRKISKKKTIKKTAKKTIKKVAKRTAKKKEDIVGLVTHYFPHVRAAVIKLKMPLNTGDMIKVKGHTTDFTQSITSMQIDRVDINSAKKGQEIGLLVNSRVRRHDKVYKA